MIYLIFHSHNLRDALGHNILEMLHPPRICEWKNDFIHISGKNKENLTLRGYRSLDIEATGRCPVSEHVQ